MADNRLEINPLIEENMLQMVDGEFAINQLNGHVTIKKGEEYISKTKVLNNEIIDKSNLKEDLIKKINQDIIDINNLKDKNNSLATINSNIKSQMDAIKNEIITYEDKCSVQENRLRNLDVDLKTKLYEAQNSINNEINNNLKLLGTLLVNTEYMDRISDNQDYFNNYVKNHWKYPDPNNNYCDYETKKVHSENIKNMETKVNKSDYDNFVKEIVNKYAAKGAVYSIKGGE